MASWSELQTQGTVKEEHIKVTFLMLLLLDWEDALEEVMKMAKVVLSGLVWIRRLISPCQNHNLLKLMKMMVPMVWQFPLHSH
jgi:hypothetical protein